MKHLFYIMLLFTSITGTAQNESFKAKANSISMHEVSTSGLWEQKQKNLLKEPLTIYLDDSMVRISNEEKTTFRRSGKTEHSEFNEGSHITWEAVDQEDSKCTVLLDFYDKKNLLFISARYDEIGIMFTWEVDLKTFQRL